MSSPEDNRQDVRDDLAMGISVSSLSRKFATSRQTIMRIRDEGSRPRSGLTYDLEQLLFRPLERPKAGDERGGLAAPLHNRVIPADNRLISDLDHAKRENKADDHAKTLAEAFIALRVVGLDYIVLPVVQHRAHLTLAIVAVSFLPFNFLALQLFKPRYMLLCWVGARRLSAALCCFLLLV